MNVELLELLRCTDCSSVDLAIEADHQEGDEVIDGKLRCRGCDATFPVKGGIVNMLPGRVRNISPDFLAQWLETRKRIEKDFIDDDIETYKERFREAARKEGLDEATDGFLWEVRLYQNTIEKWGQHWEEVPERFGMKWAREEEGEADRNEKAMRFVRSREGRLDGRWVLNLGSGGDVDLVKRLEAEGARVICIDIVPEALLHLRRSYGGPLQGLAADLANLPFRAECIDHVVCVEVIHHVQPIDRAVVEIARISKVGGTPYVVEVNPTHFFSIPGRILPDFFKRFVRKGIRVFFKSETRYLEGSPYEQITPIDEFAASLERNGFRKVGKDVVVHPPAVLPRLIIRLWEWLAERLPAIFDPLAIEYILWGTKPERPAT